MRRFGRAVVWLLGAFLTGRAFTQSQPQDLPEALRPGTRIEVELERTGDGGLRADEIEVEAAAEADEELRGRLGTVMDGGLRFELLGFTVVLRDDATVTREPEGRADPADLIAGLRVKVDGRRAADGSFQAKKIRIRADQADDELKVVGPIESATLRLDGTVLLRVVGLEVVVDRSSEVAGVGANRFLGRQRLGSLDDDDLLFTGDLGLGTRTALAGEVRLRGEWVDNPELDDDTEDRELVPEIDAQIGVATDLGAVFGYLEVQAEREYFLESEDPFEDGTSDVRVSQAYLRVLFPGAPWLAISVGRQQLAEDREWYYDTKNLDMVRLLAVLGEWTIDASLSRALFNESRNQADQDRTNVIVQAAWVPDDDYRYDIHAIAREDRTELENSPYYLGVRATGEPGRHLRFWADLVHGGGERGRREDESTPVLVRRVDAFAFDAGVLLRPRIALDPTFVASYAMASGDPTNDLPVDEQPSGDDQAFRQTGLHRNRDKYRGTVSFRYYGDAIDPELSNLRIATLAAGIRPVRAFSVDLAFHRYEQDEASAQIVNSDIDADPNGEDPYLGKEWNLIVGYEPSPRVELRFTSGYFDPGPAFGPGASSAKVVRFQSKFRF